MTANPIQIMPAPPQTPEDKGPYRIKRIQVQVEVEHFDAKGKTTGVSYTEPMTLFEADFPEGLLTWLKARGLSPSEPTEV
jgi:hypothetical protein